METRIVRINGVPYRVPIDELTDAHPDLPGGSCRAEEPENPYGAAVCTLDAHPADVMHIAGGGEGEVIAMWGEPTDEPSWHERRMQAVRENSPAVQDGPYAYMDRDKY